MKSLERIERREFSVAISSMVNAIAVQHLLANVGREDVAFALYKPSFGLNRFTALIHELILPNENERIQLHAKVEIKPEFFKRACRLAAEKKSGLGLLHSHLGPGWQGMSAADVFTERSYSSPAQEITGLPIIGMTLGTDQTWSARIWELHNEWHAEKWAESVRVIGKRLIISFNDALRIKPKFKEIYKRTITVWGEENHANLARLRVCVVGLGSVGMLVVEALARMGVERFILIDFDEVQLHNLDRLSGATMHDVGRLKIEIAQRLIMRSATASQTEIRMVPFSVTEKQGYEEALDCDVIFSCVDRPWPRHVLNHLAYNHLIPVVDGGIKVRFDEDRKFEGADWQVQIASPERICLSCLGSYLPADVSTEREGKLDDPTYLAGLPKNSDFKNNENIFPFSMNLASLEIFQMIELVTAIGCDGETQTQRFAFNEGYIRLFGQQECFEWCMFKEGIAMGDTLFDPPTGFDHSAELARKRQAKG
jgi:ThiF family protein